MANVNLSSQNRGSTRTKASDHKRELKKSKDGVIYREHKMHDIAITWEYLKEVFEGQNGRDYWFPEYEIDLQEIFVPYSIKAPSVDRLDETKGYIEGNVVITTRFANLGRGNFKEDEFRAFTAELWNL